MRSDTTFPDTRYFPCCGRRSFSGLGSWCTRRSPWQSCKHRNMAVRHVRHHNRWCSTWRSLQTVWYRFPGNQNQCLEALRMQAVKTVYLNTVIRLLTITNKPPSRIHFDAPGCFSANPAHKFLIFSINTYPFLFLPDRCTFIYPIFLDVVLSVLLSSLLSYHRDFFHGDNLHNLCFF